MILKSNNKWKLYIICCSVCPAIWLIELDKLDTRLALQVWDKSAQKYRNVAKFWFTNQEAREAALLNNQTTMAPTTTMMMTTSNPDFGLDLLSQNDSFNKSLDIDLSVLNDIGVDSLYTQTKQKYVGKNIFKDKYPFLRFLLTCPKFRI